MNPVHNNLSISCEGARAAVEASIDMANKIGIAIQVSIVDSSGNLVAHLKMDGAFIPSCRIAQDKAYTAVGFGQPTSNWQQQLQQGTVFRESIMHQPGLAFFGGGVPIVINGDLIGGIGVSGGSEEQDETCALAGCAALATDR